MTSEESEQQRIEILERTCRAQSDRLAALNREVHTLRNATYQTDRALVSAARRWAEGPVTEEAVAAWFNQQRAEDFDGTGPMEVEWHGLHEWHRRYILGAAQHFGAPPEV